MLNSELNTKQGEQPHSEVIDSSLPNLEKPKKSLTKFYISFGLIMVIAVVCVAAVSFHFKLFWWSEDNSVNDVSQISVVEEVATFSNVDDTANQLSKTNTQNVDFNESLDDIDESDVLGKPEAPDELEITDIIAKIEQLNLRFDTNFESLQNVTTQLVALSKKQEETNKNLIHLIEYIKIFENTTTKQLSTSNEVSKSILHQLKNVGVEIETRKNTFPLIVYSKSVWGNKVFLNVAQTEYPEQSIPLEVGNTLIGWKLINLSEESALFESIYGKKVEVKL